jgi:UDP-GlcNAc:undecaprenyl-phosphate GlcNAc-1-phosphate transferase
VFTPVARRYAVHVGVIDRPVGEKIHRRPTPLMGGTAIYLAFVVAAIIFLPLSKPVVGVLVGGFAAVAVGVIDERFDLSPPLHLLGQVGVAALTMTAGIGVLSHISNPLSGLSNPGVSLPLWLGVVVTVVWLVGMMNTINFLDGLDGLAGGVSAIAAFLLAGWASETHPYLLPSMAHHEDLILPVALAGALLGFLVFNWHPARIFMGDSGSMFLGLALASLSIVGPAKLGTALLVLLIPVLDVAWAIIRRRMRGRSFLSGDKQHVYHRMMELGLSHLTTVVLLYVLAAALAILDLVLGGKVLKLVAFVVLTILIAAGFATLEARAVRRQQNRLPGHQKV